MRPTRNWMSSAVTNRRPRLSSTGVNGRRVCMPTSARPTASSPSSSTAQRIHECRTSSGVYMGLIVGGPIQNSQGGSHNSWCNGSASGPHEGAGGCNTCGPGRLEPEHDAAARAAEIEGAAFEVDPAQTEVVHLEVAEVSDVAADADVIAEEAHDAAADG